MDRKAFYDAMRQAFGPLNQSQVDGTEQLLDSAQHRRIPLNQLAYLLATSWHETAATMQPIAEYGKGKGKKYGVPVEQYGGQVAYGRGYVQLTWSYNYEKADSILRLDGKLLANFELALDPLIASNILFEGCLGGWFTGKSLGTYVTSDGSKKDYVNARRVVNGTDRADLIAGHATNFEKSLKAASYDPMEKIPDDIVLPEPPPPDVDVEVPPPPVDPPFVEPDVPPEPPAGEVVEPEPEPEPEEPPPMRPAFPDIRPLENQKAIAIIALVGLGVAAILALQSEDEQ